MTTTTSSICNGKKFTSGKDSEKVTTTSSSSPLVQEWFNAQVLPGLPLHLELILMGLGEVEGVEI
jgi:hypothetical protein